MQARAGRAAQGNPSQGKMLATYKLTFAYGVFLLLGGLGALRCVALRCVVFVVLCRAAPRRAALCRGALPRVACYVASAAVRAPAAPVAHGGVRCQLFCSRGVRGDALSPSRTARPPHNHTVGLVRTGSVMSAVTGGGIGAGLIAIAYADFADTRDNKTPQKFQSPTYAYVVGSFLLSLIVTAVMADRFFETGKVMPGGIVAGVSACMAVFVRCNGLIRFVLVLLYQTDRRDPRLPPLPDNPYIQYMYKLFLSGDVGSTGHTA